jgi:hypothetical protein
VYSPSDLFLQETLSTNYSGKGCGGSCRMKETAAPTLKGGQTVGDK